MARVRFYTEDGENYCTLRVETDGLYLLGEKVRLHRKRETMPPKRGTKIASTQESSSWASHIDVEELTKKILHVFDDLEQTLRLDDKSMVSIKPAYKKPGFQIGLFYLGEWTNLSAENIVALLLAYYVEVIQD